MYIVTPKLLFLSLPLPKLFIAVLDHAVTREFVDAPNGFASILFLDTNTVGPADPAGPRMDVIACCYLIRQDRHC